MSRVGAIKPQSGLNGTQWATIVMGFALVSMAFLVKIDRAPSYAELLLDPIRLMIPLVLMFAAGLREKLGITRRFAQVGFLCVLLTVLSEVFSAAGIWFLIPAFAAFVWMLANCRRSGTIDSSWAGLVLCLVMAPVF
jgi:hypothetical protein